MGRRSLLAAVAATTAALLSACTAAEQPDPETPATEIGVAAGVSLSGVFAELAEEFEAENPGTRVRLELGRSVDLARGMGDRDDIHVFAATGQTAMGIAVDAGAAADPRVFARNLVVLAVPAGNHAAVEGLADLARPELRVGLCIMDGPCGRASAALLVEAGVGADVDERVSDSPTLTERLAGNTLDAGIVFRTDVAASRGWVEEVDADDDAGLRARLPDVGITDYLLADGPAALGESADDAELTAAAAFRDLVASDRGRRALVEAGFVPLGE